MIWSPCLNAGSEMLSCREGRKTEGTHSEICKLEQFKEWIQTFRLINQNEKQLFNASTHSMIEFPSLNLNHVSYSDVKLMASEYQSVKLKV